MKVFIFSEVSLDGKLTIERGTSSKELLDLLEEEDYKFIHSFRNKADGIIVGKTTIDIDNPSLTNRYFNDKQPIRIIPSKSLDFDEKATIFTDDNETIIVTTNDNKNNPKIKKSNEYLFFGEDEIDFKEMLEYLENERNIKSIMIEGGGEINYSFIKEGLIDEIILLQMPVIVGGRDNVTLVGGQSFGKINLKRDFKLKEIKPMKNFIFLRYEKSAI